ncbi:MAG: ClbS/DfsB family four-helix bundle protein [Caldilineaceae bacterium]|nr:ClbS/DfsB family four-helix bundle protein [Caldilineaceae bacterium]
MKIVDLELIHLDVPFTPHTNQHMQYWLPHWRISQLCKITLDNGIVGWGETIPNYTWSKVPADVANRVVGRNAGDLLWQDELGAGVQMALFDAVGKALGVPVYRLLGHKKLREWAPISWWAMDMPPADWAEQCAEAVRQGYMSAKLKARTWYDLHAALQAIFAVAPEQFILDLDFNATLDNAANAVKFLSTLEPYKQVAMFESPIPQEDVAGNAQIRRRINRPVAMHYGSPPIMTTLHEDVADGFVLCAGAAALLRQAHICQEANKPFWLQLVGTGVTTTWAAHFGAVLPQAKWPAITCMNIYESQLVKPAIELRGGFLRVPERPGLGVEIDEAAVEKYRVDYVWLDTPRHLYRYCRANGEVTYYACGKQDLHHVYPEDAQPICEPGATLDVVADDGGVAFAELYAAVHAQRTLRRREIAAPADLTLAVSTAPTAKATLLRQIQVEWAELTAFIASLTPEQMERRDAAGWAVKDHLAHLIPWAAGIVALLQRQPRWPAMGLDAPPTEDEIDAANARLHAQRAQQPLHAVLLELARTHQQVLETLAGLTDADLRQPYSHYQPNEPGEESGAPILGWVAGNTWEHYQEHLGWMRALVR